jgi:hypothetical protein
MIGQAGEGIGNILQQSNNATVSETGSAITQGFNPAQALAGNISQGKPVGEDALTLLGLGFAINPLIDKHRKDKNELPLTDPYQINMLNDLKRKQRSLETGTADQAQQDMIKQAGTKAMDNIVKLSGGNIGVATSQINAAQRATGKNMNELFSQMSAESFKMDDLMEGLVGKIANRKLQIQAYEKAQANVTSAQNKQNVMQNLMAAYAKNPDMFKNMFGRNIGSNNGGDNEMSGISPDMSSGSFAGESMYAADDINNPMNYQVQPEPDYGMVGPPTN